MLHERKNNSRFPLTHEKIARLLGVHRPSVTLIAKKLRDEKALEYSRARISIVDREKLKSYACSCYSG
jgi:Mn-dependent DtxR family transcriptional regulator